ncbi:DUF6098 family protein [Streptomyces griseomycini]|uniref:Uncharacterized protein n=1 Tax=Streptomyces griseomycini TaxID=66895 RepID=A0A7W7PRF4_9ACTN|nr:DUF6098 family protein [Streptomyces griseomycini]MBB4899537.1 hypothetical protein [Streptomyces griseomycini]GGP98732.1 hypothetical protein GCM10010266_22700 [Streptomyces griseomycini]GGR08326.1 hypothetical protein GCM10015536_12060 [Streptomyces griseomycini]
MSASDDLPVVESLAELTALVERDRGLYVRWSRGPATDLRAVSSKDDLTGVAMSGLSANPLDVEEWWQDRSVGLWVARRLHDYAHLPHEKGRGVRPWVLKGRENGRGPDNEPLVTDVRPLCWIDLGVIDEAQTEVARQEHPWGPLRRTGR